MKAVIQRVSEARVLVENQVVGSIRKGLCVLVGVCRDDTDSDIDYMARKLLAVRLFEDETGRRWAKGVKDMNYEILCVSQFTLHAQLKGNKPDFRLAMGGEQAPLFYQKFLEKLKSMYASDKIQDGKFGAMMDVQLCNDGPVTLILDSRKKTEDSNINNDDSSDLLTPSASNRDLEEPKE